MNTQTQIKNLLKGELNRRLINNEYKKVQSTPSNELTFTFKLFQARVIHLGKETYKSRYRVPQSGKLSPILFKFAMHNFIQDLTWTRSRLCDSLSQPPNLLQQQNIFLEADDIAIKLDTPLLWLKPKLKLLLTHMIQTGDYGDWKSTTKKVV